MIESSDPRDAALDWLVRTNDPDFDGWDEFTAWLEASAANADAYHRLAANEAEMLPLVEALEAPVEGQAKSSPDRRMGQRRLAAAASVAIFVAAATAVVVPRLTPVEHSTGAGEIRMIALGGQDQLVMNGDTRLALSGWDRRTVRLEQGQVLLRLRDAGQGKVELVSGDLHLIDVGTVFEVARDGTDTRVLVSEGAVVADPAGARLKIAAGQRLDTEDGAQLLKATEADVSSVGSFESGQLVYLDEPLENVVADLRRSAGIDFSADASISGRRFTGTLSIREVRRDPQSLGPLLGVSIERSTLGWNLKGKG
jgi:transmembrane sensor